MNIDKKFHCLSCGKILSAKEQKEGKSCAECVLDMKFEISEINHRLIDEELPRILDFFISDVSAAFNKDPAAYTLLEVLTSYPGVKAVLLYRVAHFFWKLNMPYIPRYISDIAREITGIEIHPGAEIGSEFFIDHGTGVVIGETSEIGNNVTLYSGVVLGGTSNNPVKRHPTLRNNIVVGTGAKLLGPITIDDNVKIGANSVVINDVPSNSVVVGVPGKVISREGEEIERVDLKHADLPDPLSLTISGLNQKIVDLEKKISSILLSQQEQKVKFLGIYGEGI